MFPESVKGNYNVVILYHLFFFNSQVLFLPWTASQLPIYLTWMGSWPV